MRQSYKITGHDAIRLAERDSLTIKCDESPFSRAGKVSISDANLIAKEDADLVYVNVKPNGWFTPECSLSTVAEYNVSDYFTTNGMYLGPDDAGIEPRWDDATEVKPEINSPDNPARPTRHGVWPVLPDGVHWVAFGNGTQYQVVLQRHGGDLYVGLVGGKCYGFGVPPSPCYVREKLIGRGDDDNLSDFITCQFEYDPKPHGQYHSCLRE